MLTQAPDAIDYGRRLRDNARFAPLLDIVDKWGKRRRLKLNTVQRLLLDNIRTGEPVTHIVVKARQVGITTALHAMNLRLALTRDNTRIMTLFDKDDNTTPARQVVDRMYESIPAEVEFSDGSIASCPRLTTDNTRTRRYDNGSTWTLATAGGKTTGRSQTLDVFHGSEVAYWVDPGAIASGALEAAQFALVRVLESTANGAGGWFYEQAMRAADGDKSLRVHFFPWWLTPEYALPLDPGETLDYSDDETRLVAEYGLTPQQIKWRRTKTSSGTFQQEYPESLHTAFMQSGESYFGDVSHAFTAPRPAERLPKNYYVMGLDWGQQNDYTAAVVINATTGQMVDILRTRHASWSVMLAEVREMIARWNVTLAIAEANAAGAIIEMLRGEIDKARLYTTIQGFNMSASSKPLLMQSLRIALHDNALTLQPDDVLRHELGAARAAQRSGVWTVDSPRDEHGHGDTVVALALAWRACGFVA